MMKRLKVLTLCLLLTMGGYYAIEHNLFAIASDIIKRDDTDDNDIQVKLNSRNAILIDQKSGEILFQKNAHEQIYPASMTKIMTVYLAIQHIEDLNQVISVPSEIFMYLEEENASLAGFLPGQKVIAEDLLYGALLSSGAEACITLATYISGSEEAFAELMNQEAKRIGMSDTHFTNCTGLDEQDHYSSVYDIQLLLREALKDDTFTKIFHTKSYLTTPDELYPDGFLITSTMHQTMDNHNLAAPYILGGKTGYTLGAGLCLASQGNVNGKTYIFVSAGADGDGETEPYHILDAIEIYQKLEKKE